MPKAEFTSIITLQALEGQKEECLKALQEVFDDPCVLSSQLYLSEEDPEILMGIHQWSSFGVFQEHVKKHQEHPLFTSPSSIADYVKLTHWKPVF